ncbi:MAG: hypothetical protein PHT69_01620 [Bacteroidales bacterium]|nr:hypothetical protein [Bacteroidales bacterium]
MSSSVFLFPAFVLKYKGDEIIRAERAGVDFSSKLTELSEITGLDLTDFNLNKNDYRDDELKNQLLTYLFSCIFNDILKAKQIIPACLSGLSMGLYAALYASGSISFAEGALIIQRVFNKLKSIIHGTNYSMLAIIGLEKNDINSIIINNKLICEIVIKNANCSYVVSGETSSVSSLYTYAQEEGALHLTQMPVRIPYHSSFISNFSTYENEILNGIDLRMNKYPLRSAHNQSLLTTFNDIKQEITKNIVNPLDWEKTLTVMLTEGYNSFIECGPGDNLKRMSKFISGNFNVEAVH